MTDIFERIEPGPRNKNKRNILSSALDCFDELGVEATTIDAIKVRSGSSIGAIYHHFGNKEGLIAALFFMALKDQAQQIEAAANQAKTIKDVIEAFLHTYLQWVTDHPALAHFMFRVRASLNTGEHGEALKARNKTAYTQLIAQLKAAQDRGEIKSLPFEIIVPLLLGPSESYSRAWLAKRAKASPVTYAKVLTEGAWAALTQ